MSKVYIIEAFHQFCKERHAEDKGKNFNLLQEIYSKTEFFDISFLEDKLQLKGFTNFGNIFEADFPLEDFSLPFENIFIKLYDGNYKHIFNQYLFIREYEPNIITGTLYATSPNTPMSFNIPFTIRLDMDKPIITSDFNLNLKGADSKLFMEGLFTVIVNACNHINTLSKKEVLVDKPTNSNLKEYYRRKHAPTIQIPQRPIYYVLDKETVQCNRGLIKAMGTLEYSHSFKVRGHWRHISEKSIGKDRYGNYNIYGFTWVVEHVKGEGELTKRLRVLK